MTGAREGQNVVDTLLVRMTIVERRVYAHVCTRTWHFNVHCAAKQHFIMLTFTVMRRDVQLPCSIQTTPISAWRVC